MFLGPDGGHHRRGRYARGCYAPPATDATITEGLPGKTPDRGRLDVARPPRRRLAVGHPPADPSAGPTAGFTPPRGRGIQAHRRGHPVACWLPVKQGLTPHGLRHSHKTWMAEDGIPDILPEQRLGHQVPGMRGLYTHVSQTMRTELTGALQTRWEDSLRARAAIAPHSPSRSLTRCCPVPGLRRNHPRHPGAANRRS